jgi:hypothetical protein
MAVVSREPTLNPPNWLPLEGDILPRMGTRLNSIHAVADELFDLVRSGEWPLAFKQIDLNDKEIRRGFVPKDFWQDPTRPSVEIDGDGAEFMGLPHFTNYSEYDAHLLFHGLRTEYYGLARNIKAWECQHPLLAAETASAQRSENKAGLDPSKPLEAQRQQTKASKLADTSRKAPGRPSPKPLVADEIKRLKKVDSSILKGKKIELWEHLANVCRGKGYDIEPKSIGSLIRRNKMLPTQKR